MKHLIPTAAGAALLFTCPAVAADEPGWTLEGSAGVVSDYRYRGYSLSGGDPALQGGATVSHASGFYGDVWVSTIETYGTDADGGGGSEAEVSTALGWAGEWLGLDVDAAVASYAYPGGIDVDYQEIPVQIGRDFGGLTLTAGFAYAPAQAALGDDDNRYLWTGAALTGDGPLTFNAAVGFEEGAFAPDGKTDWSVGVSAPFGPSTVALTWTDSDQEAAALVVGWSFAR